MGMNAAFLARGFMNGLRDQGKQWTDEDWHDSWWVSESWGSDDYYETGWGLSDGRERAIWLFNT